jgi:hypothetical protein
MHPVAGILAMYIIAAVNTGAHDGFRPPYIYIHITHLLRPGNKMLSCLCGGRDWLAMVSTKTRWASASQLSPFLPGSH